MRRVRLAGFALLALFLLHNDLWWWNDSTLVLGLPIGLAYHVAFCLVTAAVMAVAALGLGRRNEE
ncbi:MAG: DUF3311 domain-containing protein [Acidobacteria bacterium]|nr:DUF3311 domain-containing protein [Acidobacteriota bacterium]